jgi:hypothetical protein
MSEKKNSPSRSPNDATPWPVLSRPSLKVLLGFPVITRESARESVCGIAVEESPAAWRAGVTEKGICLSIYRTERGFVAAERSAEEHEIAREKGMTANHRLSCLVWRERGRGSQSYTAADTATQFAFPSASALSLVDDCEFDAQPTWYMAQSTSHLMPVKRG